MKMMFVPGKRNKIPDDYKGTLPFDRSGTNGHRYYTKGSHSSKKGHFCLEWDSLWICEDCQEFQACKCFDAETDSNDVIWFDEILPHMIEIEELCATHGFHFKWTVDMPHIKLQGEVNLDRTVNHENELNKIEE